MPGLVNLIYFIVAKQLITITMIRKYVNLFSFDHESFNMIVIFMKFSIKLSMLIGGYCNYYYLLKKQMFQQ